MSKLVKAATWIRRHFEPGSEPAIDKLQDCALRESKGEVVAGSLYLYGGGRWFESIHAHQFASTCRLAFTDRTKPGQTRTTGQSQLPGA